jgi:hypothetical protein
MNKKSKRNLLWGGGVVLLVAIWYYFAALSAPLVVAPPSSKASSSPSTSPSTASNPTNNASAPTPEQMRAAHEAEAERERGIWNMLFLTPITFYGKVVDEKGTPIEGADVRLHPADDMNGGSKDYERFTDESGLFSITGVHGLGISVDITKKGYYPLPQSSGTFGYVKEAGGSPPYPHSNNPAIFILRKMGKTEPLIVQKFHVIVAKDGTPLQLDLKTGKDFKITNGDIQIEAWTDDAPKDGSVSNQFNWRANISVPGGGIISRSGEFDFEAPTDGYQSEDVLNMPISEKPWRGQISRDYFLKLTSGTYARVSISFFMGGYQFINATSYLNPIPGHRNLEFDPDKQINK